MTTTPIATQASFDAKLHKAYWLLIPQSQVGDPLLLPNLPNYADRSIQVTGTFAGATLTVQGSNDGGTTWNTLNDAFGNALTFTQGAIKQVTEICEQLRVSVGAGDVTTSLNAYLYMRKLVV